jgi:hypothetical protein
MFPLRFFLFNLFILFSLFVGAQDSLDINSYTEANQPIAPLLKNLTEDDKLKVLNYLRFLGSNIDDEIQYAYDQIPTSEQQKALQFMYTQQPIENGDLKTTVKWDKDTLDLGIVEEGRIRIDSFVLTNTGKNPYLIFNTKSGCDCSVMRHPIYPIKPGERIALYIEFNSTHKEGPFSVGLVIYDNSKPNSRQILNIKGVVKRKY